MLHMIAKEDLKIMKRYLESPVLWQSEGMVFNRRSQYVKNNDCLLIFSDAYESFADFKREVFHYGCLNKRIKVLLILESVLKQDCDFLYLISKYGYNFIFVENDTDVCEISKYFTMAYFSSMMFVDNDISKLFRPKNFWEKIKNRIIIKTA